MKTIITFLLFALFSLNLWAAETLSFKFSNPRITYNSSTSTNSLRFDILIKATANGTYLYSSQLIFNVNYQDFITTTLPQFIEGAFIAGSFTDPEEAQIDKYSVTTSWNSNNLNIAVYSNNNLSPYAYNSGAYSEVTTEWQVLGTVRIGISNTSSLAGISFQVAAIDGYQKYALGDGPSYSVYYNSPNYYEGYDLTDLYLGRIYSGGSGWTQAGGTVNWSQAVNTSVWDIAAAPAVVGTIAMANNLRIHQGGRLEVNPASSLTVNGTLTNNSSTGYDGLVIKSDVTGTGSLLHQTTNVPARVQRYIAKYNIITDLMFHFLSSPVEEMAIRPEFVTSTPTYGHDFYAFNEPNNLWINTKATDESWNENFEDAFIPGKGYLVAYPNNETKTFTGELNNYPASSPLVLSCTNTAGTGTGWNLLGNPFPSSIDWDAVGKGNGMDDALYYYDNAELNYRYYLGLTGATDGFVGNGSRYIPPMQGFMVHAKSTGTKTVSISNADRTHTGQNIFYKSNLPVPGSLSLSVSANGHTDEAFIHFNQGATSAFDGLFDAYKIRSYSEVVPALYTLSSDGFELAINGLPEISENVVIPLYLDVATDGDFDLSANLEAMQGTRVFLEDTRLNITQNLSENPVYHFSVSASDQPDRFKLTLGTVGIDDPASVPQVQIYAVEGTLYVYHTDAASGITISSISGQKVKYFQSNGSGLSVFNVASLPEGVYLVTVTGNHGVVSSKIIL